MSWFFRRITTLESPDGIAPAFGSGASELPHSSLFPRQLSFEARLQRPGLRLYPASTPRSNSLTDTPNPPLIVSKVVSDGTLFPRSMRLTAVRCKPQWSAKASWLNPCFSRRLLMRLPNANKTCCISAVWRLRFAQVYRQVAYRQSVT